MTKENRQRPHRKTVQSLPVLLSAVFLKAEVRCDFQRIAEQGRIAELFHQRCGKLREGVADQDHLGEGAQLVKELFCTRQRINFFNRSLNFFQSKAVLF